MTQAADCYYDWLGFSGPPNHYELLGLQVGEANLSIIVEAANQRRNLAQSRIKDRPAAAIKLLADIGAAEACLLDAEQKSEYDRTLLGPSANVRSAADPMNTAPAVPAAPAYDPLLPPSETNRPPSAERAPLNRKNAADESLPPALRPGDFSAVPVKKPGDFVTAPALRPSDFARSVPAPPSPPAAFAPPGAGVPTAVPLAPLPPGAWPSVPLAISVGQGAQSPPPVAAVPPNAPVATPLGTASQPVPLSPPTVAATIPMAIPVTAPSPEAVPPAVPLEAIPAALPIAPDRAVNASLALVVPQTTLAANVRLAQAAQGRVPMAPSATAPGADLAPSPAASVGPLGVDQWPAARRSPSWGVLIGLPAALLLGIVLLLLYLTESGPFRRSSAPVLASGGRDSQVNAGGAATQVPSVTPDDPTSTTNASSNSGKTTPPASTHETPDKSLHDPPASIQPPPSRDPQGSDMMAADDVAPEDDPAADGEPSPKVAVTLPKPPVQPPPMPPSDPAVGEQVNRALLAGRYYLAHRDLSAAKAQIDLAARLDQGEHKDEIHRVATLHHYVSEFWRAVWEAVKGLDGGEQITISGITVGIVEVLPNKVILRQAGQNREYTQENIPRGLAYGLAQMWLKKDDPTSFLILGAFHAVHPTGDRDQARRLFNSADEFGTPDIKAAAAMLVAELDVKIPDNLTSIPKPMPGSTAGSTVGDPRAKVPSPEEVAAAKTAIMKQFRAEFEAAVSAADKIALAEKLDAQARREDVGDLTRYALWELAREQLVSVQEVELAMAAVDGAATHFAIDAIGAKSQILADVAKTAESAELNKKLTDAAMTLADEALLLRKYPAALKLLRGAVATARKAKDPALVKDATNRLNEAMAQARSQ